MAKAIIGWTLLITFSLFDVAIGREKTVPFQVAEVDLLVKSLKSKEWSQEQLRQLFSNLLFVKMPGMVKINVTKPIRLKAASYAHFAEAPALMRAKEFATRWKDDLIAAETRYNVDLEMMLAIMLVETNLGTYTGDHSLMSVFASVYVDSVGLLVGSGKLTKKMRKRVKRKKLWALGELQALLAIKKKYKTNLYRLKGSYAGAMGLCQFLPSSYLRFAKRRPGLSGAPDLFQAPDAIHSIASYLNGHGYKSKIFDRRNRKAIFAYNHSDVYVNVVLKIAKRLNRSPEMASLTAQPLQSH